MLLKIGSTIINSDQITSVEKTFHKGPSLDKSWDSLVIKFGAGVEDIEFKRDEAKAVWGALGKEAKDVTPK